MAQHPIGIDDRAYWVSTLTRIADPVLNCLSNETLKKVMHSTHPLLSQMVK